MSEKSLGQVGYEAYGDEADWKAFDGRPMPRWDELREDIKRKWNVASSAIVRESGNGMYLHIHKRNGIVHMLYCNPNNLSEWKFTKGEHIERVTVSRDSYPVKE